MDASLPFTVAWLGGFVAEVALESHGKPRLSLPWGNRPQAIPIDEPDARIGTSAGGPFAGNGVYSATGAGESKTISVSRGHSGTLFVDFQNDGLVADTFKITRTGAATGFTVSYFHGTTNVTSQVKGGTYSTGPLAPDKSSTLKMVVKLSATSANIGSFLIKAQSHPGAPVDAVKVTVKAT